MYLKRLTIHVVLEGERSNQGQYVWSPDTALWTKIKNVDVNGDEFNAIYGAKCDVDKNNNLWALIQLNSGGNYLMHKYDKTNEYWELVETTGGVQDDTDGHLITSKQISGPPKIYRIKKPYANQNDMKIKASVWDGSALTWNYIHNSLSVNVLHSSNSGQAFANNYTYTTDTEILRLPVVVAQ